MQHKWHKEIKAWADGAEIECFNESKSLWEFCMFPEWEEELYFRISQTQPKLNEFSHIPYWLCCGSLDIHHHYSSCSEAKAGNPERCRFGTVEEHQKQMKKPQPKQPQYLYVYLNEDKTIDILNYKPLGDVHRILGKIKLEDE